MSLHKGAPNILFREDFPNLPRACSHLKGKKELLSRDHDPNPYLITLATPWQLKGGTDDIFFALCVLGI